MSIATDMKEYILQSKTIDAEKSGAKKELWEDSQTVNIALYETDELVNTQSVKYQQADYVGLSFYKGFDKKKNRICIDGEIYSIEKCNVIGQISNLLLKKVTIDGDE